MVYTMIPVFITVTETLEYEKKKDILRAGIEPAALG